MLFKEIVAIYSENHAKPINTKCSITDCQSTWFIQLPLGLKGLNDYSAQKWPGMLHSLCIHKKTVHCDLHATC
jgi:hypothetical protein